MNRSRYSVLSAVSVLVLGCSSPSYVGEKEAAADRKAATKNTESKSDDAGTPVTTKPEPSVTTKPAKPSSPTPTKPAGSPAAPSPTPASDGDSGAPAATEPAGPSPASTPEPAAPTDTAPDPEPTAPATDPTTAPTPAPQPEGQPAGDPAPGSTETKLPESNAVLLNPDDAIAVADANLPDYTEFPFDAETAAQRQQETAEALGVPPAAYIELGDGVIMEFELVPAGHSTLGSPDDTAGWEPDEMLRDVVCERPFYLSRFQVTREQFKALMGTDALNDPYSFVRMSDSPFQPALAKYESVRDEIKPKLQAVAPEGWTIRLPTEDEWEHAARAGTGTIWYSGDTADDLAKIGWYNGNSNNNLHDVGMLAPNAWGLYDMVGNAWHYAFRATGWYSDEDGESHIVRGGDCMQEAFGNGCRTSNYQIEMVTAGYRFAMDLP